MATLASLLVKLGLDPKGLKSGAAKARTYITDLRSDIESTHRVVSRIEAPLARIATVTRWGLMVQGATAAKASVQGFGGAVAALPAALAVGGSALAAVKIATTGVGDAMEAFASDDAEAAAEAMARLSPAAQRYVRDMTKVKESFDPVRRAIQERFFDGLGKDIRALSAGHLPGLRSGLGSTAGALNGLARESIAAANTPLMQGIVADVLDRSAKVLAGFQPAAGPAVTALGQVTKAGMPLVEQFGAWAAKGLEAKAGFLASAEGAAWLDAKVAQAQQRIGSAIGIVANLRATLSGVFGPAVGEGTDLLAVLETLTGRMATWVNSAQGQEQLGQVWQVVTTAAQTLADTLPLMVGPLSTIVGWLASMDPQTRAVIGSMLAWSLLLAPIAGKLTMLVSAGLQLVRVVPAAGAFAASVFKIVTASSAADAATARASAGIVARMTAAAIGGVVSAAKVVGGWVSMAAAATVNASRLVFAWLLIGAQSAASATATAAAWVAAQARTVASLAVMAAQFAAQGAVMAASAAATAARVVAGWVLMGVQSLIQGARMAAAWVLAMGPVGWVIAAVVGLVALIVANWDSIVAWTRAAWDKIWEFIKGAAQWIWDLFLNWSLPGLIIKHWDKIVSGVQAAVRWVLDAVGWIGQLPGKVGGWFASVYTAAVDKLHELLGWLGGLPGRILSAVGNLGSVLLQAGRDIIDGLLRGISNAFQKVRDKLGELTSLLPDWKGPATVDARILTPSGRMIMEGLVGGFEAGMPLVERYLAGVTDRVGGWEVALPRVPGLAMATAGTGGGEQGRGERSLVHIENYHPPADASASDVAHDLDWFSRGGG